MKAVRLLEYILLIQEHDKKIFCQNAFWMHFFTDKQYVLLRNLLQNNGCKAFMAVG